ncbi:hypothetical protein C8Q78DRAFT_951675, partial [Trametes maxima]
LLPTVPALDNTFGAVLLGTCFGLMLYGLTVHQSYRYFRLYPNDVPILKLMVFKTLHFVSSVHRYLHRAWSPRLGGYHILLLQLISKCLDSATRAHIRREKIEKLEKLEQCLYPSRALYFTTNYFNPTALLSGVWSLRLVPIVTGLVIFVCHSFYARRVYLIGGLYRPLVAGVVRPPIFPSLKAFIMRRFIQPSFASWSQFTWLISAGFGCAVGADLILTSTLICVLCRSRTGFKSTDSMIDVLIVYSINTGLITGIFSLLSLIFAVVAPNNLIYIGLNMVSTRSYANSVLAVLNTRRSLVERRLAELDAGTFGMSGLDAESMQRGVLPSNTVGLLQPPLLRARQAVVDIKIESSNAERAESQDSLRDVEVK